MPTYIALNPRRAEPVTQVYHELCCTGARYGPNVIKLLTGTENAMLKQPRVFKIPNVEVVGYIEKTDEQTDEEAE